jgi:aspartate kinase
VVIFTGITVNLRPPHRRARKKFFVPPSSSTSNALFSERLRGPSPRRVLIAKFGGSSLANARRISLAARAIAQEYSRGTRVVVVVSAVGRTTDRLLELTGGRGGIVETDRDDILAMGERTSARIFAASLKSQGIQSRYFDPTDKDWPIITDNNFSNANPLESHSINRIKRYVTPLLGEGIVPVIGGFIGRTKDGRVSTLGRGGSDTTALLLAKALGASEVVLVTNTTGIMSGDPRLVPNPRLLKRIDIRSLVGIADSGTKFIHRKALKFKDPQIDIRVVPRTAGDLRSPGTAITGKPFPELDVTVHNPHPTASVTLVGKSLPKNPRLVSQVARMAGRNLLGASQDSDSIILYLTETYSLKRQIESLHKAVLRYPGGTAVAARTGNALITVRGVGLEDTPGVTARITETLRANNINIFGLLTITSSILVLVSWKYRKTAVRLIRNALEGN